MLFRAMLLFSIAQMSEFAEARTCEGGYTCTLPRECCTQGCCPSYHSGPRQLTPPSEHVLNLFFISHWFFWCVVVAIILAILCAYSLWKKRRTLCGWGFSEHRAQSEGDSAGSCYAPPQYSRCSSFHHPPPPYTEVTSKPDLYPLVFTCNSDHGKTGSSYLMVQYFRNYIVRPAAGSLSAASTVDSLSSSFICNVNEANTLVPPTYSRAASPEIGYSTSFQHHYMLPRSASQLVCPNNFNQPNHGSPQALYNQPRASHYNAVLLTGAVGGEENAVIVAPYHAQLNRAESGNFENEASSESKQSVVSIDDNTEVICHQRADGFTQSQSDQHFRYVVNSNSSISDIFVNGSNCMTTVAAVGGIGIGNDRTEHETRSIDASTAATTPGGAKSLLPHGGGGGTPVIFSNGSIKPNPLQRTSTNPTQFVCEPHREAVYNSCNSIGGISITTMPVSGNNSVEPEFADFRILRRSLETCCKYLQHQQQQQQQEMPTRPVAVGDSPLRNSDLVKKYTDEGLRSYLTSGTCSGVSSLANIGTPSSPPQATSPTGEVKEILDQIRQLQEGAHYEDLMLNTRPMLHHTLSSPTCQASKRHSADNSLHLQRFATMPEQQNPTYVSPTANSPPHRIPAQKSTSSLSKTAAAVSSSLTTNSSKRPSSFQQQSKKKFYSPKPNRTMYIPMSATNAASSSRCILKSPVGSMVGASFFANRGRVRKGWISRSAPTTPGTCLPPNCLGDDSPLLNEHEEDQEGEQNAELE